MTESRRRLLMTFAGAAGVFAVKPVLSALQSAGVRPPPPPRPSPNAPDPNFPPGLDGPKLSPTDAKALKKQNQIEIKSDVTKLSELVSELKQQVEKIDTDATLSISIVKKAQQIEKLAKQIKDRAKG
jgi:hypothetical protein